MKMWKFKWGCDIFHHRSASSADKPVNAASSKVLSDQISDVITSINEPGTRLWSAQGAEETKPEPRAVNHRVLR